MTPHNGKRVVEIARQAALPGAAKPKGKLVGAVLNAGKILRFLRATQGPATVTQITRQLKINPSTCFNILRTLIHEDFVQFDPVAKTYQLSLGIVALAQGALAHSTELHLLQPKIQELAQKHKIMVTVWRKISDDRIMLVAAAESDAPVRIHARAGTRSPLLLGASGRVFTAYAGLDRAALKERFHKLRLSRPLDFETFLGQVDDMRRTGWAIDDGYAYSGTLSVAAPVMEPDGRPINFSCSAIMFNGQYDPQRVMSIADELKRIGTTLIDAAAAGAEPEVAFSLAKFPARRKAPAKAAAASSSRTRRRAAT